MQILLHYGRGFGSGARLVGGGGGFLVAGALVGSGVLGGVAWHCGQVIMNAWWGGNGCVGFLDVCQEGVGKLKMGKENGMMCAVFIFRDARMEGADALVFHKLSITQSA